MRHVGIDVHEKYSQVCEISKGGTVLIQERIPTTAAAFRKALPRRRRCRVVVEAGGSTPWVRRELERLGHRVIVVNPRRVRLIAESTMKSDKVDAEVLARMSLVDERFLRPVYQRSEGAELLRVQLRVRSSLVKARTAMVNSIRGVLRAQGYRPRSCKPDRLAEAVASLKIDRELAELLNPLLETLHDLNQRLDTVMEGLVELSQVDELPLRLQTIPGVGPIVCVSFIAWLDSPERFARSRDVGPCLGLRPEMRSSGEKQWTGRINREGDCEMRRLLVQAAHAALHSRKDSQLLRWARSLAQRVGKKKATVALARKIAILLHRLWVSGEEFRPFPQAA